MNYTIEIDEYSLEATADVLRIINPGRSSADYIRAMVMAKMRAGSTSLSTAGWEATGFFPYHKPGVMVVRFAVAAYTVQCWLDHTTHKETN
jgi:hypothetical protein